MKSKNLGMILTENSSVNYEKWVEYIKELLPNKVFIFDKNVLGLLILIFVNPILLKEINVSILK